MPDKTEKTIKILAILTPVFVVLLYLFVHLLIIGWFETLKEAVVSFHCSFELFSSQGATPTHSHYSDHKSSPQG